MSTYLVEMNINLAVVYYNREKPNLFRINVDVILFDLKDRLDQINDRFNHRDTIMMVSVKYCRSSIDSDGSVWFI